jgi:hypothetical protein
MAGIHSLIAQVARQKLHTVRTLFDSEEDLTNELMGECWTCGLEERDIEVLRSVIYRAFERVAKRHYRRRKRFLLTSCLEHHPAKRDPSSFSSPLTVELVVSQTLDSFEYEAVLAEIGLHPEYPTFADFATYAPKSTIGSRSNAYRRRAELFCRLRKTEAK